eukprot:GFKZ01000748.1.p1 GENE.GFKZ01000748.1~~GFKZ01000748.1.p1  ORF type:complete len:240 (+),score=30.41 GFKZ01000748.1:302-1021(+)
MDADMEDKLRDMLKQLYRDEQCMPIMVRLAFHDAGTYDITNKTGGSHATIRFKPESEYPANAGLNVARDFLEPIKAAFPEVSYADLYQLAGIVAVEVANGPIIPFTPGRQDLTAEFCPPDGTLPGPNQDLSELQKIFNRMGFHDEELVLLSGAHCLGMAHKERSGFEGPWTTEPLVFDNAYYIELLRDPHNPSLLLLPSDLALLTDPATKALVQKYADDLELFFADYAKAHEKFSKLGM